MAYLGFSKGGGQWRARRARAYKEGLGGKAPLKLKRFLLLNVQWEAANSPIFSEIWKRRKSQRHIRCNLTW